MTTTWGGRAAAACGLALLAACAQSDAPIALRDMGSFHVGGREVTISGKPTKEVTYTPGGVAAKVDPNGVYQADQMYVQYFIPQNQRGHLPLLMWHGGGLTGVTYETTPDGREGWLNYFVKKGWATYNSDAVERGRASWAQYPDINPGEPVFLTKADPFERFRMGMGAGSYNNDLTKARTQPGTQFPVIDGYNNFTKQVVPRWTTSDNAIIAAYIAEVDKICPCVVLIHSQAGQFGLKVAAARPDKVKALVLVEPAGVGDPAQATKLKGIPILAVFGDYIEVDARWPQIKKNAIDYLNLVDQGRGYEVIDLPKIGIQGNSHMMMMDKNNLVVAGVIQKWLEGKNLYH